MACHLVVLPKGTIQMEVVTDQILDGVVTKSLPRGGHADRGSFQDERYGYREEYGLNMDSLKSKKEEKSEATVELTEQDKVENNSHFRRDVIRFTFDSMANNDVETRENEKQDSDRSRTKLFPQLGDEVRFRVAKHRKTGVKRATDLSITLSAREKLEKRIEAKLATMTRENGVVNRVNNGGGFIKCCDRPIDIYFPFHEVLESKRSDGQEVESGDT
ncbi:hypothetical protein PsorP6_011933 [Peronosclerospora sorghi]|uniref:Uncharacterized protein n=1 Tax=Peronosclerospora sorghi TaxID=230839 RepID=A0ACC0WLE6_9STRA|nr:hypothetical protein PsorP6_011933 [Peronosclerospora sorghi]